MVRYAIRAGRLHRFSGSRADFATRGHDGATNALNDRMNGG
jgi:hypothetical protein